MRGLYSLILVAIPTLAVAGPKKPLPASKRPTPIEVAENATGIDLGGGSGGYHPLVFFTLSTWGENDRIRVEWKQKGKVLSSIPCKMDSDNQGFACKQPSDKPLKAKGAIEVDVIVDDDADGNQYLVRTFKVTVEEGKKDGFKTWTPAADELLALAYAWHYPREGRDRPNYGRVKFQFWAGDSPSTSQLRCTADGKKLDDINTSGETWATIPYIANTWAHVNLTAELYHGSKDQHSEKDQRDRRYLIDNPGKWDCMLRSEGKVWRQFLFTVNKEGMIEDDEMQTGKRPITTQLNTVLIDVRIPKDSQVDQRIRPDLMKKSVNFGLPWPDHPKVKTIHAAFPPKRG